MDPGQFGVISVPSKNEELLVPGKPGVFVDQTSLGCLWIRQAWGVCGSGKPGVFVDQANLGCLWIRKAWGVSGPWHAWSGSGLVRTRLCSAVFAPAVRGSSDA